MAFLQVMPRVTNGSVSSRPESESSDDEKDSPAPYDPLAESTTGGLGARFTAFVLLSVLVGLVSTLLNRHGARSYAVCSAQGEAIYTVDDAKPQVQCILVHGSRIQATGALGPLRGLRLKI